jgi:hypothetical protein
MGTIKLGLLLRRAGMTNAARCECMAALTWYSRLVPTVTSRIRDHSLPTLVCGWPASIRTFGQFVDLRIPVNEVHRSPQPDQLGQERMPQESRHNQEGDGLYAPLILSIFDLSIFASFQESPSRAWAYTCHSERNPIYVMWVGEAFALETSNLQFGPDCQHPCGL